MVWCLRIFFLSFSCVRVTFNQVEVHFFFIFFPSMLVGNYFRLLMLENFRRSQGGQVPPTPSGSTSTRSILSLSLIHILVPFSCSKNDSPTLALFCSIHHLAIALFFFLLRKMHIGLESESYKLNISKMNLQELKNDWSQIITAHPWCNGHYTSISTCRQWGVRAEIQVSRKKLHIHMHLYQIRVEFLSLIYIYIYKLESNLFIYFSFSCKEIWLRNTFYTNIYTYIISKS